MSRISRVWLIGLCAWACGWLWHFDWSRCSIIGLFSVENVGGSVRKLPGALFSIASVANPCLLTFSADIIYGSFPSSVGNSVWGPYLVLSVSLASWLVLLMLLYVPVWLSEGCLTLVLQLEQDVLAFPFCCVFILHRSDPGLAWLEELSLRIPSSTMWWRWFWIRVGFYGCRWFCSASFPSIGALRKPIVDSMESTLPAVPPPSWPRLLRWWWGSSRLLITCWLLLLFCG